MSCVAVCDFVGVEGVETAPHGSWVSADVTVAQAEALLGAQYHSYLHADSGVVVTRLAPQLLNATASAQPYSLPNAVAAAVDFVAPTTSFPPASLLLKNRRAKQELKGGEPNK